MKLHFNFLKVRIIVLLNFTGSAVTKHILWDNLTIHPHLTRWNPSLQLSSLKRTNPLDYDILKKRFWRNIKIICNNYYGQIYCVDSFD